MCILVSNIYTIYYILVHIQINTHLYVLVAPFIIFCLLNFSIINNNLHRYQNFQQNISSKELTQSTIYFITRSETFHKKFHRCQTID